MKLGVKVDMSGLQKLADLGGNLPKVVGTGVRRILLELSNQITLQIRGGALHQRSGRLAKAWTVRGGAEVNVTETAVGAAGSIGTNNPYARIQEEGGTVKPVSAQMLAIPLGPAKTAAGVSRFSSPRQVPGLFMIKSRAGNLLLVKAAGRGALEAWYVLKTQVRIPASRYLTKAAEATQPKATPIMDAAIGEAIAARSLGP